MIFFAQRKAGDHLDKKGSDLLRLESEPPATDSPHVVAICVDRSVQILTVVKFYI